MDSQDGKKPRGASWAGTGRSSQSAVGDYPPISPCGRICDQLKACYTTRMRFYADQPDYWHEVVWYWVPATNPYLDVPSCFYSRNWDKKEQNQEPLIGELYDYRPFYSGQAPYFATGAHYCGTDRQWAEGSLAADPKPTYVNGVPLCCATVISIAPFGGVAKGGAALHAQPSQPGMFGGGGMGGALVTTNWAPGLALGGGGMGGGLAQIAGRLAGGGGGGGGGQVTTAFGPCENDVWPTSYRLSCRLRLDLQFVSGGCTCIPSSSIWIWDPILDRYLPPAGSCMAAQGMYVDWNFVGPGVGPRLVITATGTTAAGTVSSGSPPFTFQTGIPPGHPICGGSAADGFGGIWRDAGN